MEGQVLVDAASQFQLEVAAEHGDRLDGFAAVDDFRFRANAAVAECETLPQPRPPVTTTYCAVLYLLTLLSVSQDRPALLRGLPPL